MKPAACRRHMGIGRVAMTVLVALALVLTATPVSAVARQSAAALAPSKPPPAVPVVDDNKIPGKTLAVMPTAEYSVSPTDAVDYYNFTVPSARQCWFRFVQTGGTGSAEFTVYEPLASGESTLTTITPSDWHPDGRTIVWVPSAGKAYLRVRAVSGTCTYRIYGFDLNDCIPGDPLDDLLENVIDESGALSNTGDRLDVYTATLEDNLTYRFNVARKSGSGSITLKLFGSDAEDPYDDTPLATATGTSMNRCLTYRPTTTGTYHLAIMWSGGSGTYRLAQAASPFSLDRDGYSFDNFGGYADQALFESVFGLWSATTLSTQESSYFNSTFKNKYGGGQCYGFAVTAGMFYRLTNGYTTYGPWPSFFIPGSSWVDHWSLTRQITRSTVGGGAQDLDDSIERHISKYQYYQYDPVVRDTRFRFSGGESKVVWDFVNTELDAGWHDPYVLGFSAEDWGHAVNITGIRPTASSASVRLVLYDNNFPDGFGTFDDNGGAIRMYGSEIVAATVRHVSPHEKNHIDPLWDTSADTYVSVIAVPILHLASGHRAQVVLPTPAPRLLHTDSKGRRLGTTAEGDKVSEIPGGELIISETGNLTPGWRPPLEYYLPKGQDYTVETSRPTTGTLSYRFFMAGDLIEFDGASVRPSATARIKTARSKHAFSFQMSDLVTDTAPPTVSLRFDREVGKRTTRRFDLSGLKIPSSQVVTISATGSAAELGLESNAPLPSFRLGLTGFKSGKKTSTLLGTVPASSATTQSIVVWNWASLATTPLFRVEQTEQGESITALRIPAMSAAAFGNEMVARRLLGSSVLASQIQTKARLLSTARLKTYLNGLVTNKSITKRNAGLLFAYVAAARTVNIAKARPGSVLLITKTVPTLVK